MVLPFIATIPGDLIEFGSTEDISSARARREPNAMWKGGLDENPNSLRITPCMQ
jgi:hypothetical protein